MEEYKSNLRGKINNLTEHSLNSEQKEIDRLLVRKEKELLLEQEKWKQILQRNKTIYYTVSGIMVSVIFIIFFFSFLIFIDFEKKQLKQTVLTKNEIFKLLRKLDNSTNNQKGKKLFTKQHNTVNYKGKKYLKILNTDFMELPTQPKYRYLRLK